MHGGRLTPDNVRLAHRLCNQRDYMVAGEDQRDARKTDVAGGDRRGAEREEGSNDSRHEQMDSCICSEGIRFLEALHEKDLSLGGKHERRDKQVTPSASWRSSTRQRLLRPSEIQRHNDRTFPSRRPSSSARVRRHAPRSSVRWRRAQWIERRTSSRGSTHSVRAPHSEGRAPPAGQRALLAAYIADSDGSSSTSASRPRGLEAGRWGDLLRPRGSTVRPSGVRTCFAASPPSIVRSGLDDSRTRLGYARDRGEDR